MMTEDETATQRVIGGVDTHKDVHVAAVLDELGRLHDTATFATTTVIGRCIGGCAGTARSSRSGSKAPAHGVQDCHGSCGPGA
jgi:hypothetical protein